MQFGVYSVADVTRDPVTGIIPSEAERIDAVSRIARMTEEVGLDVFAIGERHHTHHVSSSPTLLLATIAAHTHKICLSTAVTIITTNDPVRLAEEYSTLQHLCQGRLDVVLGPPEAFRGHHHPEGSNPLCVALGLENYNLLYRLWREEQLDWEGEFRAPLVDCTTSPRPLDGVPPYIWHSTVHRPVIADEAASYGDGLFLNTLAMTPQEAADLIGHYRSGFEDYGSGTAAEGIVGLGGEVFLAENSQDARAAFRPYFNASAAHQQGMSLEDALSTTALAVGSPQEVIERMLELQEIYGDYQRQLFWIDRAGLPVSAVMNQLELLAGEVVPVLRQEFESRRQPGTPSQPPSHADLVQQGLVKVC
ncbi:MAG: LLM class flavin-dependent oxidoreductase [Propionibacteriaceae bacterium]|nr:LLM class flavin-dependent oxidoreductase [Propionibacteriaceae bacterium]